MRKPQADQPSPSFAGADNEALSAHAVAALLAKMPNTTDVDIFDESSARLIAFSTSGPLIGQIPACAIVVSASSLEASQPSLHDYLDSLHAQLERFSAIVRDSGRPLPNVILTSLVDIPAKNRPACEKKLQKLARTFDWVCGKQLFDLFEEHYPDFLADEARAIRKHIKQLATLAQDTSAVAKLAWSNGHPDLKPSDPAFFVDLTLVRKFHSYSKGETFCPLPTVTSLNQLWTSQLLGELKWRIRSFAVAARRACDWGYMSSVDSVDALESAMVSFAEFLERQAELNYREKDEDKDIESRILGTTRSKPQKYGITSPTRLKESRELLLSVTESWSSITQRLSAEISDPRWRKIFRRAKKSNTYVLPQSQVDKFLHSVDIREACRFDEFAKTMPERSIRTESSLVVEMPERLLSLTTASLLIVGGPGSGKSSYCRWNALRDAERLAAGQSKTIPVLVPLYTIESLRSKSFSELFLKTAGLSGLLPQNYSSITRETPLRLYLDGLDEVAASSRRKQIVDIAWSGLQEYDNLQIIVTCRDYITAPWLDPFPRLELAGLSHGQFADLATKWLGRMGPQFIKEVKENSRLESVVRIPLLATLTILVFKHGDRIPSNRVGLYQMFTELLAGGWNLAKGMRRETSYASSVKLRILSGVAYSAQDRAKKEFSRSLLRNAIKHEVSADETECNLIFEELLSDGLIERTAGGIQFRHLTFQEYLAARHLAAEPKGKQIETVVRDFFAGKRDPQWWSEVIKFYCEMSNRPIELAEWIQNLGGESYDYSRCETMMEWLKAAFPEAKI